MIPRPKAKSKALTTRKRNHSAVMMTSRQVQRMREGRIESTPADFKRRTPMQNTDGDGTYRSKIDIRRALEDRKIMRELGLLDS